MQINLDVLKKLVRYGLVSVAALIIDLTVMMVLIEFFETPILWASGIGFTSGGYISYYVSKHYVFDTKNIRAESEMITMFIIIGFLGLSLNQAIMYIGVEVLKVHYLITKSCALVVVFTFNFLIRGLFVFKDPDIWKMTKK